MRSAPATKENGPGAMSAPTRQEQNKELQYGDALADVQAADKRITSAQARAALAGFALHVVAGAGGRSEFLAHRWGRSITLPDIEAVERWVQRVTGV